MRLQRASHFILSLALVLGAVACTTGCKRTGGKATIRVSGAWALYPAMVRWAEVYQQQRPGVRVDVAAGGAGKGMTDCLAGLVDLGMLSRDVRPEEAAKGITPLPVAKDAVFLVVNAENPATPELAKRGLTRQQLAGLWMKGARQDWGTFANGAKGEVRVYTRSDACGAAETWAQFLGGKQEDLKGVAVYGDPGLAEAVRKDMQGVGYNNLNFAFDARTGLPVKGLAVVPLDANGAADVSTRDKALAAIRSGAYPAPPARDLYVVLRKPVSPAVRDFLTWILNEGQRLAPEAGYVPVSDAQRQSALAALGN